MDVIQTTKLTGAGFVTRILIGFLSGVTAVLLFHQGALTILHAAGATSASPFPTQQTHPVGLPQVWSLAFWGGVWGLVFSLFDRRLPQEAGYWWMGLAYGAVLPSIVAWLIVFPLKGMPVAGGWAPAVIAVSLVVNGAWGIGNALFLRGLSRGWIKIQG
jgi:hypothetical protein